MEGELNEVIRKVEDLFGFFSGRKEGGEVVLVEERRGGRFRRISRIQVVVVDVTCCPQLFNQRRFLRRIFM